MIIAIVAGFAVLLVGIALVVWLVTMYNGLVTLGRNIEKAWSNIDVLLKQRHDELPKLLDTVKGYMKYEEAVLLKVTEARAFYNKANTVAEKGQASGQVSSALKSLFAVAEKYPDLKANQSFMQLQGRISTLETDIADRREFYNESVNTYNIRIHSIPDMFIAKMMNCQDKELFQVAEEDRQDVKIEL